jgi:hypothetical protein
LSERLISGSRSFLISRERSLFAYLLSIDIRAFVSCLVVKHRGRTWQHCMETSISRSNLFE